MGAGWNPTGGGMPSWSWVQEEAFAISKLAREEVEGLPSKGCTKALGKEICVSQDVPGRQETG